MNSLLKNGNSSILDTTGEEEGIVHFSFSVDTNLKDAKSEKTNIELDINVDIENSRIGVIVKKKAGSHIGSHDAEQRLVTMETHQIKDGRNAVEESSFVSCLDDHSVCDVEEADDLCKDYLVGGFEPGPIKVINPQKVKNKDKPSARSESESDYLQIINEYNAIFCKPNIDPTDKTKKQTHMVTKQDVALIRETKGVKSQQNRGLAKEDSKSNQFRRWCRINEEEEELGLEIKPRSQSCTLYPDLQAPRKPNGTVRKKPSRSSSSASAFQVERIYVSQTKSILPSSSCTEKCQSELSLQKGRSKHTQSKRRISRRSEGKSSYNAQMKSAPKTTFVLKSKNTSLGSAPTKQISDDVIETPSRQPLQEEIVSDEISQDYYSDKPIEDYLKASPKSSPTSTKASSPKSKTRNPKPVESVKPVVDPIGSPYTVTEDDINNLIDKCPQIEKLIQKYSHKDDSSKSKRGNKNVESSPLWLKRKQVSETLSSRLNGNDCDDLDNIADIDNILKDSNNNDIPYDPELSKDILKIDKAIYDNLLFQKQSSKAYIDLIAENMADAIHNGRRSKQNSIVSEDITWNKLELKKEHFTVNELEGNQKTQKQRAPIFRNNSLNNKNGTLRDYIKNGRNRYEEILSANEREDKINLYHESYKDEAEEVNRIQQLDELINTLWPE